MRRNRFWTLGMPAGHFLVFCLVQFSAVLFCSSLEAQERLRLQPSRRSDQQPIPPPAERAPTPPLVSEEPPPSPAPETTLQPGLRVFAREITVTGSTVFSKEELSKVTQPYTNREVTSADLEALRRALTLLYVEKGYVNSGAILPDQTIVNGVVRFEIVEGKLSGIEIDGNRWLNGRYYRSRLARSAGPPLNVNALEERLQILQQDERVRRIRAELKPGVKPGESELKMQVEEPLPFALAIGFNNYQTPSVGAEQGFVSFAHRSLTGHGDILSFTYAASDGANPQIYTSYALPFTPVDTTLVLHYEKNNYDIVEDPFKPLDITSKSDIYGIGLRQPLHRSLNQEFALALTGERLHAESTLLGEGFSFAPGEEDGESTVTALRLSLEWLYRTQVQVIAARSRFSFGLDALGSTINPDPLPDSRFFAWLGQFQWARIWGSWGIQSIFRTDIQLANDPLLPLEQIAVGGRYSVRGYREDQFVRDNAVIASLEIRIPLVQNQRWADYLQLAPFIDFGRAWYTTFTTPPEKNLIGVGIGLRWGMTLTEHPFPVRPEFEIYWGYPLKDLHTNGDDLQDKGIYLQFMIAVF